MSDPIKYTFYFCSIVCMMCCLIIFFSEKDTCQYDLPTNSTIPNGVTYHTETYKGHTYLIRDDSFSHGSGMTHDPDCSCKNHKGE